MTLSLGIDIGTSGVRTAVLDQEGAIVATARAAHKTGTSSRPDARDWWDAVAACIRTQVASLADIGRTGKEISRIAVDGTSGSMVLTDDALSPVGPALMYNSKGFVEEARRVAAACPEQDHITLGSNSALSRALRLQAEAEQTPRYLLHQADFIAAKLMGRGGRTDANNALKTGFDPNGAGWPDWIEELVGADILPTVDPVGTAWDTLQPAIAADLGLSPRVLVYAGTTDSIAAFLAAAPLEEGVAVTSIGSTLAIKVLSSDRVDLPAMGLYSHRVGPYWLVGGASNTGGAVLAHFFKPEELSRLSTQIDPLEPSGLDYYPLLEPGERFPINDPNLAPRLSPRPASDAEFLKALFEGIAAVESASYRLIAAEGGPLPGRVFSAGGASSNEVFTAIRARILGLPLAQAQEREACVGAARIPTLFA
ncbi:MAG: FGGY-family carbohydrate kinase [Pseudomonadota bacterium]